MMPKSCSGCVLALAAVLGSCGKTGAEGLLDEELAERTPCAPLQNTELAASLAEPLGVGRSRSGTLYAISRVGSSSFVWRSLDNQLIAYPVYQENSGLGATIFGVNAGSVGFALTLRPATELESLSLRLFDELDDAIARPLPGPQRRHRSLGGSTLR